MSLSGVILILSRDKITSSRDYRAINLTCDKRQPRSRGPLFLPRESTFSREEERVPWERGWIKENLYRDTIKIITRLNGNESLRKLITAHLSEDHCRAISSNFRQQKLNLSWTSGFSSSWRKPFNTCISPGLKRNFIKGEAKIVGPPKKQLAILQPWIWLKGREFISLFNKQMDVLLAPVSKFVEAS